MLDKFEILIFLIVKKMGEKKIEIIQIGNPVLRQVAKKVVDIKIDKIETIVSGLTKVMLENDLIGIAAPQIGVSERIFLTQLRTTRARKKVKSNEKNELKVFINPEIVGFSEELVEMWEGCGSVAESNFFVPVIRPKFVSVRAFDKNGREFTITTDGLLARVIQHEFDHLEGILFIDRLCDFARAMSAGEYYKMVKNK